MSWNQTGLPDTSCNLESDLCDVYDAALISHSSKVKAEKLKQAKQ